MIRTIVAIDEKRGMADERGIPWRLPTDLAYYRQKTSVGEILMGYTTYTEFAKPFHDHPNYVATPDATPLRDGFIAVKDARAFLQEFKDDIWVIGGAGLLNTTLDLIDELYLTRLSGDFHCTKFFPEFEDAFQLKERGADRQENGITFRFEVWQKRL